MGTSDEGRTAQTDSHVQPEIKYHLTTHLQNAASRPSPKPWVTLSLIDNNELEKLSSKTLHLQVNSATSDPKPLIDNKKLQESFTKNPFIYTNRNLPPYHFPPQAATFSKCSTSTTLKSTLYSTPLSALSLATPCLSDTHNTFPSVPIQSSKWSNRAMCNSCHPCSRPSAKNSMVSPRILLNLVRLLRLL